MTEADRPAPLPTGRRILVTGAASGIGLSVCRALVDAGAEVVGLDLNTDAMSRAAEGFGPVFTGLGGDMRNAEGIDALVQHCRDTG